MLCSMYVAQVIPWGFMATTLPAYLVDRGLDFGSVSAALSFTTLPYAFKWVWGPIIDRFTIPRFGRRRPWIIFAQGMMAATVIAIVAIPDLTAEIQMLAWMILIHTVFNALQDVSVDALAVDLLGDSERGVANGLMYGSKYIGGLIGGYGMASVVASSGLRSALLIQTIILVAIMFVPLLVKERANEAATTPTLVGREIAKSLGQAFSLRSTLVAALLMLASNFAIGTVTGTGYNLFVATLQWKPEKYTAISGGWGLLVGGLAAMSTGKLVDWFGRRRVAAVASIAIAAGWFTFAMLRDHWDSHTLAYVSGFWEASWTAVFSVALIALCMDLSWSKIGGSQFAAYMALSNFSTTLGYQFAARANELWEFHGVYLAAAALQMTIPLLLLPIDPAQSRRELADTTPIRWPGVGALLAILVFLVAMTAYVTAKRLGYL
jgi:PAT family beta-lactamase induction signal transducer AmpG